VSEPTPKKNPLALPGGGSTNGPTSLRDRVRSLRLPDQPTGGGGRLGWLPWALAVLFAVSTAYLAVQVQTAPAVDPNARNDRLIEEQTKPGGGGPRGDVVFESKGNVVPFESILVSPLSGGMLVKLDIFEGKKVKQGELLGLIDDTEYRADYLNTKARLLEAEAKLLEMRNGNRPQEIEQVAASLQEAEALLKQCDAEYKRNMQIGPKVAGATDYDKARFTYETQMAKVRSYKAYLSLMEEGTRQEKIEAGEATVEQLRAELIKQKKRLDDCRVKAPVTGTILTKETAAGNFINPLAFNTNSALCKMADLSQLEIDLSIQEREIAKIEKGQKCRIRPDAYPDRLYHGEVSRVMPIADRGKGAVPVRVKVFVPEGEQGEYLKPEMSVFVSFLRTDKGKK
jgi:multidrug resistance efflux pump